MNMSKSVSFVSGALASALMMSALAFAAQPHMDNAIEALERAKSELSLATPNKGGHREKALGLVSEALQQVRQGKAYAEK